MQTFVDTCGAKQLPTEIVWLTSTGKKSLIHGNIRNDDLLLKARSYGLDMKRTTIDARVMHAGKAGAHQTRTDDFRKGRRRKPKHQKPKHMRWRE